MKHIRRFHDHYLVSEVALRLGIHVHTVHEWARTGVLHFTVDPVSGWKLYDKKEINTLAQKMKKEETV